MTSPSAPVSRPSSARCGTLLTFILIAGTAAAFATDLSTQKLFGKWGATPTDYLLGEQRGSAALSPKWTVIGSPVANERGVVQEGGVQVFDTATGNWVRKLVPPTVGERQSFGWSVAISGDLALIGAPGTNENRGRAYLYNLATGRLLRTLSASDGAANHFFGFKVVTNGVIAAVTSTAIDASRGAVYLFNVATGGQFLKVQASDGAAADFFGLGLAIEGNILAVGAHGHNSGRGAVYFYDLTNLTLIKKLQPAGAVAGDEIGAALAMHGGRVVLGNFGLGTGKAFLYDFATDSEVAVTLGGTDASFGSSVSIAGPLFAVSEKGAFGGQGRVHLFRSSDGSFVQTIAPPNGETAAVAFGAAVALEGHALLATAPNDGVQNPAAGAAHLIKPFTQPMPYTKVVATGDFAPGTAGISYGAFREAFVNEGNTVYFVSPLTGWGAGGNRDTGAFADIVTSGSQKRLLTSREILFPGVLIGAVSRISGNDNELVIGYAGLTGTGINRGNNQIVWCQTNVDGGVLLRTGDAVAEFGGATLASVPEAVTSNQAFSKQCAAVCTLRVGGGTSTGDDSGIWYGSIGTSTGAIREGAPTIAPLPVGNIGQFAPRVCYYYSQYVYSAALTGSNFPAASNAAIFRRERDAAEELVARKGDEAVDTGGVPIANARYSSFIGESANGDNAVVYRALLTGPASVVTRANNEGLWRLDSLGGRRLILRKGQELGSAGLRIARILHFWATGNGDPNNNSVMAMVQLSGPGVNSTNDQALLLRHNDSAIPFVLMREGDPAPGCPGGRIGVISRVEVDAWSSSYAVLATLSGAASNANLALFTGNVLRGDPFELAPLRRPFLRLRKGQLYDNQPGRIRSISLPVSNITPSGAGGTGRGRAISYSNRFACVVEFDNGVRQIMKGVAD